MASNILDLLKHSDVSEEQLGYIAVLKQAAESRLKTIEKIIPFNLQFRLISSVMMDWKRLNLVS